MTHKDLRIAATKLKDLALDEDDGPLKATQEIIKVVRQKFEKIAPLQKRDAFDMCFKKGHRKASENVADYVSRRFNEYERLKALTNGETMISDDLLVCLHTFCLI